MFMKGKSCYREFLKSMRIGMRVSIKAGSRVIIDDSKGNEKIEVLDETIKGVIKAFLFGRVIIEDITNKNTRITAHPSSLFK